MSSARSSLVIALVVVGLLALVPGGAAALRRSTAKPTLVVIVHGRGSVTSAPAGISCPGKCTAVFKAARRVRLLAKPKRGSKLLRWRGACSGAGSCRITVRKRVVITA